jgi:hypothetical protein
MIRFMIGHGFIAVFTERLMDRLRPGWRERKERRKSPWHLLKLLIMFPLVGGTGYVLFRIFWLLHIAVYDDHAGKLQAFLGEHQDTTVIIARGLMIFPLILPAIGIGLVLTNLLLWCIPWARQAFEAEAVIPPDTDNACDDADDDGPSPEVMRKLPGGAADAQQTPVIDPEMAFRSSTLTLLRFTLKYLVPLGCGLALVGALLRIELP